ncbi:MULTISPECIES: adenylyl-sulfate kinase [unclassified Pseudomonas]|uniref:adenylyl-sulfate kinase n=1 Tax=unclassified Pseudomonas TaxID=196821 RepID=UPI002AC98450|nr:MULTISPECIES: adenylyl-sulfate kinase [unclassified Pseudomonas]MEB0042862.1 adenylyl-sulfate kinase [Pseudomonas sp. MH10]MEB0077747.1 adenylyl-sulfate kinase [Pseudomonas sp. MH10out]MEB0092436.1 adenylyl-sulfate kinase [Pseudomonas sp. CCI4.2]MEB0102860.1 adenylyl-sulfate kinase [Pseudomonas sp. CCI3.2]MEB0123953.1 adenylyl-sulfate kinase [Pseudomonas sp. CCI1.2]
MTNVRPLIIAPKLAVGQALRAGMKQQRACCVWFTGLSGAGKSTLGNQLDQALQSRGMHSYLLDGDRLRLGLCQDLGMTDADRHENVRRIAEVAKLMVDAGLIVIVSAISPFRADRDASRDSFAEDEFFEVHVNTPLSECVRRDAKGLYRAVKEGRITNFTGIDSPYEAPLTPEFVIDTSLSDCEAFIEKLVRQLRGGF